MAMVSSFSTQGFIYLHVAAGEIKLQNIGETTEKAKGKNRALTPLTPSPNYRGWSVLGCRRMCLAQHHCDNNPGIMSSVLQMTGLSNMSTSQSPVPSVLGTQPVPARPRGYQMSNYEHDINVIKKPFSELCHRHSNTELYLFSLSLARFLPVRFRAY